MSVTSTTTGGMKRANRDQVEVVGSGVGGD